MTGEDDAGPFGTGSLSGLYMLNSGSTVTLASLVANTSASGKQSPESINFIPAAACSLTIAGKAYGGFLSVFAPTNPVGQDLPLASLIDGFLFSDIDAYAGKAIETFEYSPSSTFPGITGPGAGGTGAIGWDVQVYDPGSGTYANFANVDMQLEGFNLVTCNVPPPPPPPGGCPATQGFWHKGGNWPTGTGTINVDGVIYNYANQSMKIGTTTYTQAELLQVMPSGTLHPGDYGNSLSQFIAAVLNIAAGAQHTAAGDAAISSDATALAGVSIFCGSKDNSLCSVSSTVVSTVEGNESALDDYNSAVGLGCSEGAGLNTGSGKD
jgi:hypothetical protein